MKQCACLKLETNAKSGHVDQDTKKNGANSFFSSEDPHRL